MRTTGLAPLALGALGMLLAFSGCRSPNPQGGADVKSVGGGAGVAVPASGLEEVPEGEAEATAAVTDIQAAAVRNHYNSGGRPAKRDAHAKHHGCVRAKFQINETLPAELQSSVFVPGKSYDAWIRFSNGAGKDQHDKLPDGRGMAIKVMGVEGEKVLTGEPDGKTQDFLMINGPQFFVRNAKDYVEFSQASADGNPLSFFLSLTNPTAHLSEFKIATSLASTKVPNMLTQRYWSMVPIMLKDKAIKYSAKPCIKPPTTLLHVDLDKNYLRKEMVNTLSAKDVCYEFSVQLQADPAKMPVEDATVDWDESLSPFRKVATITIPKQTFDTPAQQTFCENLSLTPWHATTDMRPLGGINRVRKVVYEAISKMRHEMNGAPRQEPDGSEVF